MAQIIDTNLAYIIEKVRDGGFIVTPDPAHHAMRIPVFAATDIDHALLYIKDRLNDVAAS